MVKILTIVSLIFALFVFNAKAQNDTCSACITIVNAIEGWLQNTNNIAVIEQYFDTLCVLLGDPFSQICADIVEFGIQDIINYINQNEPPTVVCQRIGACFSRVIAKSKKVTFAIADPSECTNCEAVVDFVEDLINSDATEQEIENILNAMCSLTDQYQIECEAIVEAGIPQVISWILANENSTIVCSQLGVCSASKSAPQVAPSENCATCQEIVQFVEVYAEDNATVAEVKSFIEGLCVAFGSFSTTCTDIVSYGVDNFINFIKTNEDPKTACTEVGLCLTNLS